jgi:putative transposase
MRYRRAYHPGGSFFFTVVTQKRQPLLAAAEAVEVLRQAFRTVQATRPFTLEAMVVLPDHLHCVWTLPDGDADFPTRWRLIKTWFTKHCDPCLRQENAGRNTNTTQGIWQHRYWEHALRDETDFARHLDYIHYNPVKHGYAVSAMAWPYSSFHQYVKRGIYPADWGKAAIDYHGIGKE